MKVLLTAAILGLSLLGSSMVMSECNRCKHVNAGIRDAHDSRPAFRRRPFFSSSPFAKRFDSLFDDDFSDFGMLDDPWFESFHDHWSSDPLHESGTRTNSQDKKKQQSESKNFQCNKPTSEPNTKNNKHNDAGRSAQFQRKRGTKQRQDVDVEFIEPEVVKETQELLAVKVDGFTSEDIFIKVRGRNVEITGRYEEGDCEDGNCMKKEFSRVFQLPRNVDKKSIKANFDSDGILRIIGDTDNSKKLPQNSDSKRNRATSSASAQVKSKAAKRPQSSFKDTNIHVYNEDDDDVTIEVEE